MWGVIVPQVKLEYIIEADGKKQNQVKNVTNKVKWSVSCLVFRQWSQSGLYSINEAFKIVTAQKPLLDKKAHNSLWEFAKRHIS